MKTRNLGPRCGDARGSDAVLPGGQRTWRALRWTPCLQTGEALCHPQEDAAVL